MDEEPPALIEMTHIANNTAKIKVHAADDNHLVFEDPHEPIQIETENNLDTERNLVSQESVDFFSDQSTEDITLNDFALGPSWLFGIYIRYLVHPRFTIYRALLLALVLDALSLVYSCLLLVPLLNTHYSGEGD